MLIGCRSTAAPPRSHLQKFRLSEGVSCSHGARGHAASLRRLQQHLPPLPAVGLSGGRSLDAELAAPAAKRARSSPTALASPGLMAASSGVWPTLPALPGSTDALPVFLSGLGASAGPLPEGAVPVLLPQPAGLPLPPLPLPGLPSAAEPAAAQPEQPEGIDKLLELAELAAAQHDELHSLELGASSDLDSLGQQLAAAAPAAAAAPLQQQPGAHAPEVASRVAALQEQQAQLKAALAAHAQQHARLAEQLADLRRSVAEVLTGLPPQALTPAQLQKLQQQQQAAAPQLVKSESAAEQPLPAASSSLAAASAVLQAVAQQQSLAPGATHSGPNAAEVAAGPGPHLASLLALFASAANSMPGAPAAAHLQQLMQHASLLAGPRPLA